MPRSHPPAVVRRIASTLTKECRVEPGSSLLLAVSGGSDSMVLLHVLGRLRQSYPLRVLACGVDHGLRSEAASELAHAETFCRQHDIPFVTCRLEVARGGNLQARARAARYAALREQQCLLSAQYLATAHHQLDRAETVLLRLLRGAGPEGLGVLTARSGDLLRPMIRVPKEQVEEYLRRNDVPHARDPSNHDPTFLRARVRHELLPLLKELSPGIVGHLEQLADELVAEPLPTILDAEGARVRLNRGQREQVRQALRYRQLGARVLLSGSRVVVIDPATGQPRVIEASADVETACGPERGPISVDATRKKPTTS